VVIAVLAIGCLIAGTITWGMTSGGVHCPSTVSCPGVKPHRHHPLRAELLWAVGVLLAIIAAEVALWQRRQAAFRRSITNSYRYERR
jgi:hypothetical protein